VIFARTSWRAAMTRSSPWLGGASYLQKWLILGVLIGTMAGIGTIVFYEALLACTHFFLGTLAGYHVPTPVSEGGHRPSKSFTRPWALAWTGRPRKATPNRDFIGAEDGIRTRDPHLGKVVEFLLGVGSGRLRSPASTQFPCHPPNPSP
jgi:hypothetical protein